MFSLRKQYLFTKFIFIGGEMVPMIMNLMKNHPSFVPSRIPRSRPTHEEWAEVFRPLPDMERMY